jgi:D-hydroxyproline dehydrogenase subunit gamma
MLRKLTISINGRVLEIPEGTNLAAVLLAHKIIFRRSVQGEPRAAFCAMGLCGECRVRINDMPQQLACRTECMQDMRVQTDE